METDFGILVRTGCNSVIIPYLLFVVVVTVVFLLFMDTVNTATRWGSYSLNISVPSPQNLTPKGDGIK